MSAAGTAALAALLVASVPPGAAAGELKLVGFLTGRGLLVEGPPSWLSGGFGRFPESGRGVDDRFARRARAEVQAALDWAPTPIWNFRVHGVARDGGRGTGGFQAGVTEAFVSFAPELNPRTTLWLRMGSVFLPTSRENTTPLWSSPFAPTLSALDSWIAEELRPTVLEATLVRKGGASDDVVAIGGAALVGADTTGALLAWRGWTLGDRLITIGEGLPLPPLAAFEPGGAFASQRRHTTPTAELDGRVGGMARVAWSRGRRGGVQVWALDNAGDRRLHRGQYAWRTQLVAAGATIPVGRLLTVVADAMVGRSGMGPRSEAHVDIDFRAAYVLASLGGRRARISARYDAFRNRDRDHSAEPDDDDGHAWSAAALWSPIASLTLALEGVRLVASRPAAVPIGSDGRRILAELRLRLR